MEEEEVKRWSCKKKEQNRRPKREQDSQNGGQKYRGRRQEKARSREKGTAGQRKSVRWTRRSNKGEQGDHRGGQEGKTLKGMTNTKNVNNEKKKRNIEGLAKAHVQFKYKDKGMHGTHVYDVLQSDLHCCLK
jgi:hypothetical protein